MENMKPKWARNLEIYEESVEKREALQSRQVECMYLLCLMLNGKAGKGKDKGFEEELRKARVDEKEGKAYGTSDGWNGVKQLLGIMENPEDKSSEKTVSDNSSEGKEDAREELCVICNEAGQANNRLVYLAHVYKDKSICGVIHGGQCKSNTLIAACPHTIHANCYIKIDKENVEFKCPACNKIGHCILPATLGDERLTRMC